MATSADLSNLKGQLHVRAKGHDKCPSHKKNQVVFLCQDCDLLICTTCSIKTHKTHNNSFVEISETTQQNKNKVRDFVCENENKRIPKLHVEKKSAEERLSTLKSKYKNIRDQMKLERDQCKDLLDRITEDYLTSCDKMEDAETELLTSHITDLDERIDTLVKLSSECKQTLQTGTDVLVYDSATEVRDMDINIPRIPDTGMIEFTPSKDKLSHLKQAMGVIETSTDHLRAVSATGGHYNRGPVVKQNQSTELGQTSTKAVQHFKLCNSPTIISKFSYRDKISSVCPITEGRAWLCNIKTSTLNLINNKGEVLQQIQHNSNIRDISLDPITGCLWFCCFEERTIYEVSTSSTPVRRFTTEYYPHKLSVTREGRVVVGTGGRQGYKVVIYTTGGQVLHTVIVERSGSGGVRSITQCPVTGNIAVMSCKLISEDGSDPDNYTCHIIVYNPTLQPLVHYRGEGIQTQETVTPDKFHPITVVYDSKGNIVIPDWNRKTIELITGDGKYIKTLHTNKGQQGVVGIQSDDVLWSRVVLDTGETGFKLLKYYSD
ncbi:tripartite motif-containing protein 2-like [Ylistrum balloti]|uniref:tripartite motif-containing protein 2-like n=1 Tax=Ylistrum balloti TaxID=509963 RepID=UPI0029058290|nr:tripartite motif-containing protein 2-like [Ylistrum balloti]